MYDGHSAGGAVREAAVGAALWPAEMAGKRAEAAVAQSATRATKKRRKMVTAVR
jgi:hypothetical protein